MIYGVVGTLDRDTMMKFGLFNQKTGRFQRVASKKGNGKTMVLCYYAYREWKEDNRKVYTNFHTTFSLYRTAQEIFDDLGRIMDLAGKFGKYGTITEIINGFDRILNHNQFTAGDRAELYELRALYNEYFGSRIFLTEFQKYFNSLGTSTKTIKWIEGILTQLRKLEIDLMWDSQRPISAGNRSREYTETFLVPQKFHLDDGTPCDQDVCDSGPDREHIIKVYSEIPFREEELCTLLCSVVGKLYETNEIIGDHLCSPVEKSNEAKEKARKVSSKRKAQEEDPAKEEGLPDRPALPEITPEQILDEIKYGIGDEDEPEEPEPEIPATPPEPDPEPEEIPDLSPFKPCIGGRNTGKIHELIAGRPVPVAHIIEIRDEDAMMVEVELRMIAENKDVPDIIKSVLPQFKEAGKVHGLFLRYFTEDGVPKMPHRIDVLHDEVKRVIKQS